MITTESIKKYTMPCAIMRNLVAFPGIPMTIDMDKGPAKKIFETAAKEGTPVFIVCQKDAMEEATGLESIHSVGVTARIKQVVKTQSGIFRVIVEPMARAVLTGFTDDKMLTAEIFEKTLNEDDGELRSRALLREIKGIMHDFSKFAPKFSREFWLLFDSIRDLGQACDFAAENLLPDADDKQTILEEFSPAARARKLIDMLEAEKGILEERAAIKKEVDERMKKSQRDYYLREQLKVIHEELGDADEYDDDDLREFAERLEKGNYPEKVKQTLTKEIKRLSRIPFGSAENTVLRNYIDICLEIPYLTATEERIDIPEVKRILDEDHDGLTKVKDRIVEYLAALKLNPELKGQIICLVGPPGTGKTSIATSIARATNRKFVRVSLGGVHDEAEIRGHRKTYIGSMPGRIVNALIEAKANNPLILLDEIDKMAHDMRGDPASAMLEVLDREQNKTFRDNFVELPIDLSNCMFITTANSLETISRPLLDRMEIIELPGYTAEEKLMIAKNHLIKKQMKLHELTGSHVRFSDKSIRFLIDGYTREAGVRRLEQNIASLLRKCVVKLETADAKRISITPELIKELLGPEKYTPELIEKEDLVGVVNGLAYSAAGGCITQIEVAVMPGTGKLELTGSLGDVMKESAKTAHSFVRSIAEKYGIDSKAWQEKDIHIHAPEGAVPKDGPSAGITMATAILSALGGFKVDRYVTMTGEISLTGRVMRIGGLREKSMAAYKSGAKKVIIPLENMPDLWDIDEKVKESLEFIPVTKAHEVFAHALKYDKTFDISPNATVNFSHRGSAKLPVQNGRGKRNEV